VSKKKPSLARKLGELNGLLGDVPWELAIVDPKSIRPAPKNARFMPPPMFARLVENVKKDGQLSSVPLCIRRRKELRVVSGNHRVRAAVEAGLDKVLVLVQKGKVGRGREVSMQLSHNAIVGEDDPEKLADLYREITDLVDVEYSGIPIELVEQIEKDLSMPSSVPMDVRVVVLAWVPHEVERAKEIFDRIDLAPKPDAGFMFPIEHWDAFLEATEMMRRKRNIISPSTAVLKLLEIAERWFEEHPEDDLSRKEKRDDDEDRKES